MPYNYPFFGFPNFYYNPYNKNTNLNLHNQNLNYKTNSTLSYNINKNTSSDSYKKSESEEVKKDYNYENNFLNFLGLSMQPDDLLLLGLIFFLYKEGNTDTYLYIALLLLLLS